MIVCPVCENQQVQGDECDVCGKKLVARPLGAVATAPMPELELTPVASKAIRVQAERMQELEGTRLQGGPDLPPQAVPELEATQMKSGPDLPPQQVADMDSGRAEDDGVRTVLPTDHVICRYCRTPNPLEGEATCVRCGMRLQRAQAAAPKAAGLAEGFAVCRDCGTVGEVGKLCRSCGARVAGSS